MTKMAATAHLQSTTGNPHQDRGLCCSVPSLLCSLSSADRERRELQENSKVSDLTEKRVVHGIGELELPVHPRPRFLFPFPHERLQWLHSPQDSQVASTEAGIWFETCIGKGGGGVEASISDILSPNNFTRNTDLYILWHRLCSGSTPPKSTKRSQLRPFKGFQTNILWISLLA